MAAAGLEQCSDADAHTDGWHSGSIACLVAANRLAGHELAARCVQYERQDRVAVSSRAAAHTHMLKRVSAPGSGTWVNCRGPGAQISQP
jgi:hypothetical protein